MADPAGLYIVKADGSLWTGRRRFGGALTSPVDDFNLRTTKPGASNAGLPAGWAPKRTFTTQQYITSGTLIEDVQFDCFVDFRGTGITLNRCLIQGTPSSTGRAMLRAFDATCANGPQNVISQCEIAPQNIANTNDCVMAFNLRSYRCNFYHGVDTFSAYIPTSVGTDLNLLHQGSWFHDLAYFCPDPGGQASGTTHNDGNQHHNGAGETFEGCFMSGFFDPNVGVGGKDPGVADANGIMLSGNYNSMGKANGPCNVNACWQVNTLGSATDFHYLYNWVEGGISTWNFLDTKLAGATAEFVGNRISPPKGVKGAILNTYNANSVIVTASGNTLADGTPVSLTLGDGRSQRA